MRSVVSWAVTLLVGWILFRFVNSFVVKRRNASKARQLGCRLPPAIARPWWDTFGVSAVPRQIKASREGWLLERIMFLFQDISRIEGFEVRTFGNRVLGRNVIGTRDPENIKAVLATQFEDFEISEARIRLMGALLGEGIFVSNGPQWAHHRALLRPSFTRDQINDLAAHEKQIKVLMQVLPADEQGWTHEVDLQPLFFQYTLDHATEFLFGESANVMLDALRGTVGPGKVFGDNFDYGQELVSRKFRVGPFAKIYKRSEFRKARKTCYDYIDNYVTAALQRPIGEKDVEKGSKYVFLDELVKQTRNPKEINANLLNILLAGRDTTASLLGYSFALLARHPDVFQKLRRIIVEEFGGVEDEQEINFANLKSCSYLQHTLNEVLRMHSIVPANSRNAAKDTTLPRGGGPDGMSPIFVPKGTTVAYFNFATERDPKYWGNDADEFKPERFEGRKHGFEHLPFNGGPRVCIGQQLALTSAGFVIVKLLQRFDKIENMDPCPKIKQFTALTSRSMNGCKVRMHEAGIQ